MHKETPSNKFEKKIYDHLTMLVLAISLYAGVLYVMLRTEVEIC